MSETATKIVISGLGVTVSARLVDDEVAEKLIATGIGREEFSELVDDVRRSDVVFTGPFVDKTIVSINDESFSCTWGELRKSLGGEAPLVQSLYANAEGRHLFVVEDSEESQWMSTEVKNFDFAKLRFEVACYELYKGCEYAVFSYSYDGDVLDNFDDVTWNSGDSMYVVDPDGNRHEVIMADDQEASAVVVVGW